MPISEAVVDAVFREWPSERLRLFTLTLIESHFRSSGNHTAFTGNVRDECAEHFDYKADAEWRAVLKRKHPEKLQERFDFSLIYPTREGRVVLNDEKVCPCLCRPLKRFIHHILTLVEITE